MRPDQMGGMMSGLARRLIDAYNVKELNGRNRKRRNAFNGYIRTREKQEWKAEDADKERE